MSFNSSEMLADESGQLLPACGGEKNVRSQLCTVVAKPKKTLKLTELQLHNVKFDIKGRNCSIKLAAECISPSKELENIQ
jgi:hypothetical protein